jgi:predicted DNA-binding transcriptional regulator YafY
MRADRLLAIMLLLRTRGKMTSLTLAEELEVSQRTILRDVEALTMAGVPVYADGGHGGGIALDENYRVTLTGLEETEVRALFVSSSAKLLSDIGLGDAAERTLRKLFAALPAPHQPSVEHIRQRIHIDPVWWWHDSQPLPFWADLQQAVYEDRCIRVVYENRQSEIVERVLEPYSLVAKSSLWYLVARYKDGDLHTYRVSRFHQVTLLDEHFQRASDFDLATYWQEHIEDFPASLANYTFTLRLHRDRLNFAQWLTPGRWEILNPADAAGWVTVRFQMETLELAKMLVFGLGKKAEVIEPDELRHAVLDAARDLVEHYDY